MPPLYESIARTLREQITSGRLRTGDRLPTEPEMTKRFGVGVDTIRRATAQLVNEGLIVRVFGPKGGWFVREHLQLTFHASYAEDPGRRSPESDAWHAEVRAQGMTPSQQFRLEVVRLDAEMAVRLQVPELSAAVCRRCVRAVNGKTSSIQDTYYPMWLAEEVRELLSPEDIPAGTTALLAERGYVQVGYLDLVKTRPATQDEANDLELRPGSPVLVKIRTACTAAEVVRVTVEVMAGESNALQYEIGDVSAIRAGADGGTG